MVAGGQSETKNGRVGKCKTTAKVAIARKTSTPIGATAWYVFPCLTAGENVNILTWFLCVSLVHKITYKCQLAGFKVIETQESYTSKTSALEFELSIKHETYGGKRVKRG